MYPGVLGPSFEVPSSTGKQNGKWMKHLILCPLPFILDNNIETRRHTNYCIISCSLLYLILLLLVFERRTRPFLQQGGVRAFTVLLSLPCPSRPRTTRWFSPSFRFPSPCPNLRSRTVATTSTAPRNTHTAICFDNSLLANTNKFPQPELAYQKRSTSHIQPRLHLHLHHQRLHEPVPSPQ